MNEENKVVKRNLL